MGTEILQEQHKDLIKQKEENVYQILLKKGVDKKYPNFAVKYIQEDVFAIGNDKGVYSYSNEKGEPIFNISAIRGFQFVDTGEAILGSGYFEKKEGDIYKLYRVLGMDKNDKPVLENKPINPYSKEYYKAWTDIDFNATLLGKTLLKKNPTSLFSKEELKILEKDILNDIETGAILIDDLEIFLEQKKISKDFFDIAVKKIVEEKLLFQCSDERLDEVKQAITSEQLKKYYKKGYISVEIAENCKKAIEVKDKKRETEGKIGDNTSKKMKKMK